MVEIRSKAIKVGRDMNIATNGSTISPVNQSADHGGQISTPAPRKKENPLIRLIQAAIDIVKKWPGSFWK